MSDIEIEEVREVPAENAVVRPFPFKRRRTIRAANKSTYNDRQLELKDIVTCGRIERVVLKNVLCHEHLEFSPGEMITLIQGRNGSGKSSIVAAIIAGLGGASRTTDRGSLKNLIMINKPYATIDIYLQNSGVFAYKHELYGDQIIVERRITPSSSTYKLKNANGRVVSQKKEDLNRILESFNIYVDNPVTILTQERAKTFLNSTNPRDLFKFYMLSTALQQLKDDYQQLHFNCDQSSKLIREKKENLVLQHKEVKALEDKVNAINTLTKKRQKLVQLRREKQWAEVAELEVKCEDGRKRVDKVQEQLRKLEAELKKLGDKKKAIEAQRKDVDEQLNNLVGERGNFQIQYEASSREFSTAKAKYKENVYKIKNCEEEYKNKKEDIDVLRKKLQTDHSEAHSKYEADLKKNKEQKEKLEQELRNFKDIYDTELSHFENLADLERAKKELNLKKAEENEIRLISKRLEEELKNFSGARNPFLVFGPKMPQIAAAIDQEYQRGSFSQRPLGPLGSYIKVKDIQWIHIAEKVLGNLMTSFLVNDSRDVVVLRRIFETYYTGREAFPSIINTRFRNQRHNVEKFEVVCPQYCSLWSILKVENDEVANALLDQRQVEAILLIPTAQEASNLLKNVNTVPVNCNKAYTLHGDLYFPDPNYRIYSGDGNRRANYLEISVDDKRRDLEKNIHETRKELERTHLENIKCEDELNHLQNCHRECNEKLKSTQRMMEKLRNSLGEINNIDIPAPPDVFQLRKDLEENESLLEQIKQKLNELLEKSKVSKTELAEAASKSDQFHVKLKEYECKGQDLEREHEANQNKLTENKKVMLAYSRKKEEIENRLKGEIGADAEKLEQQLKRKLQALKDANSERMQTRRKVSEIELELNSLHSIIQSQEELHGDVDTITNNWREKKERFEVVQADIKEHRNYVAKLNEIINDRNRKYDHMKKFQWIYVKTSFAAKFQTQKFKGDIEVDYDKEILKIQTLKDVEGGKTIQSLSMMSGGERSFATVCFISALWEAISSPVRILDEFDIFMDIVLRKRAIEMLIDNIRKKFQYILVSPLDYKVPGDKVACFRVPSPERSRKRRSEDI